MNTILSLWLKNPPEGAVLFTRLSLVEVLINSISLPITTAARAPGKMKIYELTLGAIQISILLVSWIVLKMGYPAYSVFVVAIVANLIMFMVRLLIVKKLVDLSLKPYFRQVVLPALFVILLSSLPSIAVHLLLPEGFLFTMITISISVILSSISMYFIGLDKKWRAKIKDIIIKKINKIALL